MHGTKYRSYDGYLCCTFRLVYCFIRDRRIVYCTFHLVDVARVVQMGDIPGVPVLAVVVPSSPSVVLSTASLICSLSLGPLCTTTTTRLLPRHEHRKRLFLCGFKSRRCFKRRKPNFLERFHGHEKRETAQKLSASRVPICNSAIYATYKTRNPRANYCLIRDSLNLFFTNAIQFLKH